MARATRASTPFFHPCRLVRQVKEFVRRGRGHSFMSGFIAKAVVTLGIWTAAAVILAFGVFGAIGPGNPAIILVLTVATVSTVALWKWGGAKRVSRQHGRAEPDATPDRGP